MIEVERSAPTGKSFRFCPCERARRSCMGERNDPSVAGPKSRQVFLLTGVLRLPAGVPSGVPGGVPMVSRWPSNLLISRRVVVSVVC